MIWAWVIEGAGSRVFRTTSTAGSLSFHHLLEQRLVCRVLAGYLKGNMNPCPGLHLQQTRETAAWTVYWIRVRLFALSLLSSISGYSTPSQLHVRTTQGAQKPQGQLGQGPWGCPGWFPQVARVGTTGGKHLLQIFTRDHPAPVRCYLYTGCLVFCFLIF